MLRPATPDANINILPTAVNGTTILAFALCRIVLGSDAILGHLHASATIVVPVGASVVKTVLGLLYRVREVVGACIVVVGESG